MWTLYKKELSGFFSSIVGYLAIVVFLVLIGLMLWVFNTPFNILDDGFSAMDGFFFIAPLMYLFLIPAITMRMFAEEKRGGTMEFLLTKPLSDTTIVCAKFLAGLTLVFISLLPTFVVYFTIFLLGDPVGNIDSGSVFGSYMGLLFLGGAFVGIGLFASAITNNQIVSFIVAVVLSVFMYLGFEGIYQTGILGKADLFVKSLGMRHHYESISRGVIDTRDLIYYLSVIAVTIMATRMVLRKNRNENRKRQNWFELGIALLIVIFVNVIGSFLFGRLDLTDDHRYSLSKSTKELLKGVDEPILFRVYLDGNDMPADFKRLRNETKEILNQFRAYNRHVDYEFIDPGKLSSDKERNELYKDLISHDIQPSTVSQRTGNGVSQMVLIPAAEITYKGNKAYVQLLQSQQYVSESDEVNNSIQNLEYQLSNVVRTLSRSMKPVVAFSMGHGELPMANLYEIQKSLFENYTLDTVTLNENVNALRKVVKGSDSSYTFLPKYDVLVVAKPTQTFSDKDLFVLDQFVMLGGRVLWLIDAMDADMDSLAVNPQAVSTRLPIGMDEMFYSYGVRINTDLVMDIRCRPIPMVVGQVGDRPQYNFTPWFYFPDLIPMSSHPIVRNLDIIKSDFVSSIQLLDNADNIEKTVLLSTSEYSRVKNAPVIIDLNETRQEPDQRLYNRKNLPVAVLLEGTFRSMWVHRLPAGFTKLPEIGYRDTSLPTKMIVVSDGDIIKNRYNRNDGTTYPLGFDSYTNTMYANKEFLLNAINYLAGNDDAMASRGKSVQLRKLDVVKSKKSEAAVKAVNIVVPVLLVALAGVVIYFVRRGKYIKKS